MSRDVRAELRRIARVAFGWPELHDDQLTAMTPLVEGRDVLVVMPTGAGKSAIYQVPAMLLGGPTVVVSPLTALQRDQVGQLADSDAPEAVAVNSAQPARASDHAWEAVGEGDAEYLFLAPEQLAKDEVLRELARLRPSLLVVDEAHCVSMWGHDFRPDYLRLGQAVERLGHPRVLALTATAGGPVRDDIVRQLGLRDPVRVVSGFDRPSLHLAVSGVAADEDKPAALLAWLHGATTPGLVYTATRKDSERYAAVLAERGLRAAAYHAGLKAADRKRVHDDFLADRLDVVVATSAFGMGIDKPNVRFVVHMSVPESLDSYYQQIGRAGRDGERARALLLYRPEDLGLQKFLTARRLDADGIGEVARTLRDHDHPATPQEIDDEVGQSHRRAMNNLNLLAQSGEVAATAQGRFRYDGDDPHTSTQRATEVMRRHKRLDRSRIEVLREYAESRSCRRQFLLGYFGEVLRRPCRFCDTCDAGTADEQRPAGGDFRPGTAVRHAEWGPGQVVHREADKVTVLFEDAGYRSLSVPKIREANLLTET